MIFLRLLFIVAAMVIIMSAAFYFTTRDRRYLDLSWRVVRWTLSALLVVAALVVLQRYLVSAGHIFF